MLNYIFTELVYNYINTDKSGSGAEEQQRYLWSTLTNIDMYHFTLNTMICIYVSHIEMICIEFVVLAKVRQGDITSYIFTSATYIENISNPKRFTSKLYHQKQFKSCGRYQHGNCLPIFYLTSANICSDMHSYFLYILVVNTLFLNPKG